MIGSRCALVAGERQQARQLTASALAFARDRSWSSGLQAALLLQVALDPSPAVVAPWLAELDGAAAAIASALLAGDPLPKADDLRLDLTRLAILRAGSAGDGDQYQTT